MSKINLELDYIENVDDFIIGGLYKFSNSFGLHGFFKNYKNYKEMIKIKKNSILLFLKKEKCFENETSLLFLHKERIIFFTIWDWDTNISHLNFKFTKIC